MKPSLNLVFPFFSHCTLPHTHAHTAMGMGGCGDSHFECATTKGCISKRKRCNGQLDCIDGSDEENCGKFRRVYARVCVCLLIYGRVFERVLVLERARV